MNTQPLRVIITGSTGMVGEGVMHTCLSHPDVEAVLVINRKPCGVVHPRLTEVLHPDFYDLTPVEDQLRSYNACFFCLGVSAVGMSEEEYFRLTYTLTIQVAQTLSRLNQDMTFCYVSGAGTDSTEKGRINWARVKGKTENSLMKLPFRQVYAFRPGFIHPLKGMRHTHSYYTYITWLFPLGRALYPKGFCRLDELALAMIHVTRKGYANSILEGNNIIQASKM